MRNEVFENIYDLIKGDDSFSEAKNEAIARVFIDACHKNMGMLLGLSVVDGSSSIFYVRGSVSKTYAINLLLAPCFSDRPEFITWAKGEIRKVIETLS